MKTFHLIGNPGQSELSTVQTASTESGVSQLQTPPPPYVEGDGNSTAYML